MKPTSSDRTETFPGQAWAHKAGRIELRLHGQPLAHGDIADRLQVHEAFARFGLAYDEARLDVIASLFTEDALYEVAEGQGPAFVTRRGRGAIVEAAATVLAQQRDQRRHVIGNIVIEAMTATQARALAYSIVTVAADGLTLGATVIYSASLCKEPDGVWRFSRFFIGMDTYAGPRPTVPERRPEPPQSL